jgi:hypothetical protein
MSFRKGSGPQNEPGLDGASYTEEDLEMKLPVHCVSSVLSSFWQSILPSAADTINDAYSKFHSRGCGLRACIVLGLYVLHAQCHPKNRS